LTPRARDDATDTLAIGLYEKLGFTTEGTLAYAAFRDGEYVDCFTMAWLRE